MSEEKVTINWFPGHMNKALNELASMIKKVDAVIYVLDARAPRSSFNPEIYKIVQNKPIIYVLNKSDMADSIETKKWVEFYKTKGKLALSTNSTNSLIRKEIIKAIKQSLSEKLTKNQEKGINVTLRLCVVGVPNTGKSTLINTIASNKLSKTGNIAGVTRSLSWRKVDENLELLDNPGTLWPKFSSNTIAENLAFIGSISDNVVDISDLAFALINKLKMIAPKELKDRYNLNTLDGETLEIYEEICKNRGFLFKKGDYDYERCGKAIIDDFRKARIGKITLERVTDENN